MHTGAVALIALAITALAGTPLDAQKRANVLTAGEIDRARREGSSAYEIVETLRPNWLTPREDGRLSWRRGETPQAAPIHVYLNDVDRGDVGFLRTIPAASVLEMRWLSANETGSRYGPTNGQVAIVVTLKH
jgi:hypothetical protein